MKDSLIDSIRKFHDNAVYSDHNQLQCAINKSSLGIIATYSEDDEILKNLQLDSSPNKSPFAALECNWDSVDEVLQDLDWPNMLPDTTTLFNERENLYPASLGDGVEFASDLLISASEETEIASSSVEITSKATPADSSGVENKKRLKLSHADNSTIPQLAAPATKKPLPFLSAKEKYQLEGGKFDREGKHESKSTSASLTAAYDEKPATIHPSLVNCDKELVEKIEADIVHKGQAVTFDDISGLEFAKKCVTELICWPMSRPDLFRGIRAVPKGILLFGPPGTGKTLIGKAIAHETESTFFSISASSLTSKWIGEGEKTVRTLFCVAAAREPSVVFIDEVDSLLCQRSAEENEASRRIKTEFLVQLDGAGTNAEVRVVVIGATNRPEELDEAVRRRFVKRIYIPLPDDESRRQLFKNLLKNIAHSVREDDLDSLVKLTDEYSGADIRSLCTEAAMGPVRELAASCHNRNLNDIDVDEMPPISMEHFQEALEAVLPTVTQSDLKRFIEWNAAFGSFRRMT